MEIRRFAEQDAKQVAHLFFDTIRRVNIGDYTQSQVEAWAPEVGDSKRWIEKQKSRITFVAEENGTILGFGELQSSGHVDCFYVHHAHQRRGVGRGILQAIETEAKRIRLRRLFAEVSLTAKSFFTVMGFGVIKEQVVKVRGTEFINFLMEKTI